MKTIISEKYVNHNVSSLIFDRKFINNVEDSVISLDSICELINMWKKFISSIANAAKEKSLLWFFSTFYKDKKIIKNL